jgi:hypothetical protein
MKRKSTEACRLRFRHCIQRGLHINHFRLSAVRGGSLAWVASIFWLWVFLFSLTSAPQAKTKVKTDEFHGTVVAVGPKAITVKDINHIYHVRTFNYSPKLEKEIVRRKLAPGKRVTVHYVRGTDVAVKVD